MELGSEKGASTWLTTLPVEEFRFTVLFMMLSFWGTAGNPNHALQYCACSSAFSLEHACHRRLPNDSPQWAKRPDCLLPQGLNQHTGWSQSGCHHEWLLGEGRYERSICDVKIFSPMLLPTETATLSLATGDTKGWHFWRSKGVFIFNWLQMFTQKYY